jgi:MFS family permease
MKRKEKEVNEVDVLRSLPKNRKEVFFDLIKHRKMTLFSLSCFTFMFFIPLAVDLFYFNFLESVAIEAEQYQYLFSLIFYSMLIMLPCMVVGFLGFSGAFYVSKKIVWQEGISMAQDFFKGIKENFRGAIIDGMIFGLVLFGFVVGGAYLLIYAPVHAVVKGIGIGALILLLLLFGMITMLNEAQSVYYANSYWITFKNSFSFLGLTSWKTFLVYLLSTGVVITLACLNMVTLGVGLFLFAILNSVVIILYTLISHSAFDKYINQEHYPEMVGKGLYKESSNIEEKEA